MIRLKILDAEGNQKEVIVNEDAVVSVEQVKRNIFHVYLSDGRFYRLTKAMYTEQFEEEKK